MHFEVLSLGIHLNTPKFELLIYKIKSIFAKFYENHFYGTIIKTNVTENGDSFKILTNKNTI